MSDEDPLAALSAAAKHRNPGARPAFRPGAKPLPRPGGATPGGRPFIKKKSNPYLVPLFIGLAILAVGIPAGIIVTIHILEPAPVAATQVKVKAVDHPPGELFRNVPSQ